MADISQSSLGARRPLRPALSPKAPDQAVALLFFDGRQLFRPGPSSHRFEMRQRPSRHIIKHREELTGAQISPQESIGTIASERSCDRALYLEQAAEDDPANLGFACHLEISIPIWSAILDLDAQFRGCRFSFMMALFTFQHGTLSLAVPIGVKWAGNKDLRSN
jgi:hypothetical protein